MEKKKEKNEEQETNNIIKYRFVLLALFIAISTLLSFLSIKILPPPVGNFSENMWSAVVAILVTLVVYKIAKKATESTEAGLFAAALAVPIQLYTWKTVSQLTHTTAVFLFLLTVLGILYIKEFDWKLILIAAIAFSFVHIYSLAFIPIYLLYILFVKLEQREVSQAELYFMTISSAFILGIFALFKASPALLLIIQSYITQNYYSIAAENFTLKRAFVLAGTIPIYLGFFGAYESLKHKRKSALILLAGLIVFFLAMLFNIIPAGLGAPYFTLILTCLSGFLYKDVDRLISNSKFKAHKTKIFLIVIAVLLALGILHRIIFMST